MRTVGAQRPWLKELDS